MRRFVILVVCILGLCNASVPLSLEAMNAGADWIILEWTMDFVKPDLSKYSLITDGDVINDIRCFTTTCQFTVFSLSPCSLHKFEVVPYFDKLGNGVLTAGHSKFTTGETLDIKPSSPVNGIIRISGTEAIITWDAPSNAKCIASYEVYYPGLNRDTVSKIIDGTSMVITDNEFCQNYTVLVLSKTASGLTSDPLSIEANAVDLLPAQPECLVVTPAGINSLDVSWVPSGVICVDFYELCWQAHHESSPICINSYTTNYTIVELMSCTVYSIRVSAVSRHGAISEPAFSLAATDDEVPGAMRNLDTIDVGTSSITIGFDMPLKNLQCIVEIVTQYTTFTKQTSDTIFNRKSSYKHSKAVEDEFDVVSSQTGLESCTSYLIVVWGMSLQGLQGPASNTTATTLDAIPSSVVDLYGNSTTNRCIILLWHKPKENYNCAVQYDILYISEDGNAVNEIFTPAVGQFDFMYALTGLVPNTSYEIGVAPITASGIYGPMENTNVKTIA